MNRFRFWSLILATGIVGTTFSPPTLAQSLEPASSSAQDLQLGQTAPNDASLPTPGEAAATRPGINYLGAALDVGLGGRSTDPLGGATIGAIAGKFRVINASAFEISFRPSILLATDSTILLAGTIDFIQEGQSRSVVPYVGAGGVVGTGNNNGAFLITGGGDVHVNDSVTAFGQLNFGFFTSNTTSVSLLIGAGFNF
ncbi:hypothetical protein [Anthocerotibacter panamensis]|uniref:hypothetical protein n=1 Tax=Anthocerotibacter panamensis TaxID=2857077 RepID=UPI001C406532|nr:hypothetical protein [Anthocerotibacter panamensis]